MDNNKFGSLSVENISVGIAVRMIVARLDDKTRKLIESDFHKMEKEIMNSSASEAVTELFTQQLNSLRYLLNLR